MDNKLEKFVNDNNLNINFDNFIYEIGNKAISEDNKKKLWIEVANNRETKFDVIYGLLFMISAEEFKKVYKALQNFLNKSKADTKNLLKEIINKSFNSIYKTDDNILGKMYFLNQEADMSWQEMLPVFAMSRNFKKEFIPEFVGNLLEEFKNPEINILNHLKMLFQGIKDNNNAYNLFNEIIKSKVSEPYLQEIFESPIINYNHNYSKPHWESWLLVANEFMEKNPDTFKKIINNIENVKIHKNVHDMYKELSGIQQILWHENWFLTKALFLKNFNDSEGIRNIEMFFYKSEDAKVRTDKFILDIQKQIINFSVLSLGGDKVKNYMEQLSLFKGERALNNFISVDKNIDVLKEYSENLTLKELIDEDKKPHSKLKL